MILIAKYAFAAVLIIVVYLDILSMTDKVRTPFGTMLRTLPMVITPTLSIMYVIYYMNKPRRKSFKLYMNFWLLIPPFLFVYLRF